MLNGLRQVAVIILRKMTYYNRKLPFTIHLDHVINDFEHKMYGSFIAKT